MYMYLYDYFAQDSLLITLDIIQLSNTMQCELQIAPVGATHTIHCHQYQVCGRVDEEPDADVCVTVAAVRQSQLQV